MGGFTHSIAGGDGNLVVDSFQSPNFVDQVSGWQVTQAGDAQFNNVETRGSFYGTEFIINDAGAFFYSGTPASGNLLVSIAPAAGTDTFGNAYNAGFYIYGSGGQRIGLVEVGGQSILQLTPSSVAQLTAHPLALCGAINPGLANEYMWTLLTSGKSNSNADAAIQLFGESADGTIPAKEVFEFGGVIAATLTAAGFSVDTWNNITPQNGWAAYGFGRYRRMPDNTVLVELDLTDSAATANTMFTLPAGYQPVQTQFASLVIYTGSTPVMCVVQVTTGGAFQVLNWTKQSKQFVGNIIYSLD